MAGNKSVYQESLRKAHNYAWDRKWPQAIGEYERALAEQDSDALVWMSLGVALLEAKRVADARHAYRRACELRPDDIGLQQKLAEIYERLDDVENALQTQLHIATALQKSDQPERAVDAWRAILRLQPAHLDSHQALAELLEQLQQPVESAQEYVHVARLLRERGRMDQATERARKALALDPRNADALSMIEGVQLTTTEHARAPQPPPVLLDDDGSPLQRAAQEAIARLAESVFEQGPNSEASTYITQAIDFQTRGKLSDAVESYQRALSAGAAQAEIHLNLGALFLKSMYLEEATRELNEALQSPAYALGSHVGLAQCYRMRGSLVDAVEHALEAVKRIDLATAEPARAERLIQRYGSLRHSYAREADHDATWANALLDFMHGRAWQERSHEYRRRLDAVAGDGELLTIAELLQARDPDAVLSALTLSQEYLHRQKYVAAIEECYHAIALAPTYLPLHARMAQVYVDQGRVDAAAAKYQMLAAVQRVRGDTLQAIETDRQILKLVPHDVDTRTGLLALLEEQGEFADVIEQRIALGETYAQMAQLDRALQEYQTALALVPRVRQDRWSQTILHQMGEIYLQRAAWKDALGIYLQIRKSAPHDEKASLRLIDLYFKLGRDPEMEHELNHLIESDQQRGDAARLIPVVADMVALRPKSVMLRNHLIDLLVMAGRNEQAVVELDALGEIQLTAGDRQDAVRTIERIIALNPRNVESYRELRAQLQEDVSR